MIHVIKWIKKCKLFLSPFVFELLRKCSWCSFFFFSRVQHMCVRAKRWKIRSTLRHDCIMMIFYLLISFRFVSFILFHPNRVLLHFDTEILMSFESYTWVSNKSGCYESKTGTIAMVGDQAESTLGWFDMAQTVYLFRWKLSLFQSFASNTSTIEFPATTVTWLLIFNWNSLEERKKYRKISTSALYAKWYVWQQSQNVYTTHRKPDTISFGRRQRRRRRHECVILLKWKIELYGCTT